MPITHGSLSNSAILLDTIIQPVGIKNDAHPLVTSEKPRINLNLNENPYGLSPLAIKAMNEQFLKGNRYAFPLIAECVKTLAKHHDVKNTQIAIGSGSGQILALTTCLAGQRGKGDLIAADPTFKIWQKAANANGLTINWIPLDKTLSHDLARMSEAVSGKTRYIYICNPNNPTGTVVNDADLRHFIKKHAPNTYIVVDEAYTEYADTPSVSDMISAFPNLIVTKTFSKIYAMAALRLGYAIAHENTIAHIHQYQGRPNAGVSNVSLAAALASLSDTAHFEKSKKETAKVRAFTEGILRENGFEYVPSKANFLFFNVHHLDIDFEAEMSKHGILLSNCDVSGQKYVRVSLGTMADMQVFAKALQKISVKPAVVKT